VERSGSSSSAPNDGERDNNNDSGHIASVLLREDGRLHAFMFYRFSVCWRKDQIGLKRGKFDYATTTSGGIRRREKPML